MHMTRAQYEDILEEESCVNCGHNYLIKNLEGQYNPCPKCSSPPGSGP